MCVSALMLSVLVPAAAGGDERSLGFKLKLEATATIDVSALEADHAEDAVVSLPVAGKVLSLQLRERDLYGPRGREMWTIDEEGRPSLEGYVTARNFVGTVVGAEPSVVFLTTDVRTASVFGVVYVHQRTYNLVGEPDASGKTLLKTLWTEAPTTPPPQRADPDLGVLSAGHQTYVRVFSDAQFRNAHGNWQTRISDAFNAQHGMWDAEVDIHQWHGPFTSITGGYSTTCSTHLSSFRTEVTNNWDNDGSDAYQLFTGVDISDANGCADTSSTLGTADAVSVVVAVDHSIWDYYDPDETDDLGLVSGQELAHNYGDPHHPTDERCEWRYWGGACGDWTYNIMAAGTDHDERNFWFTYTPTYAHNTRGEITAHSHGQL